MYKDYLKNYGDYDFIDLNLNEIDLSFFSILSYFDFINVKGPEKLIDLITSERFKLATTMFTSFNKNLLTFIKIFSETKRYKNLEISDPIFITSYDKEQQFAAICLHINNINIVSFRGTDNSVVGWKENFNLSFQNKIASHKSASKYLKQMLNKYSGDFYVLGHSKGGNLAVYSVIYQKSKRDRIIKIINFDGPGFAKEKIKSSVFNKIQDKIINYIPSNSIVGMILELYGEKIYIDAKKPMGFSHDITTWKIENTNFKRSQLSKESKNVHNSIDLWNKENSDEEKAKIFKIFFSILGENKEIVLTPKNIMKYYKEIISNFKKLSKNEKEVIKSSIKKIIDIYFKK